MKIPVTVYEEIKEPFIEQVGSVVKPVFNSELSWVEGIPYKVTTV